MTEVRIKKGSRCAIYYNVNEAIISIRNEITLRCKVDEVVYKTV